MCGRWLVEAAETDWTLVPNLILRGALTGNDERDCRRGSSPYNKNPALNGELQNDFINAGVVQQVLIHKLTVQTILLWLC